MKTIEERAKSMADWLSRRLPIPEVYNLPKMFADMLTEQKKIDDVDLKETQRQRDEYYDELVKLRIEKIELANKAIKAHCSFCEAHNACVDRGGFCCPETEHIKKTMEE